jgi:ParB/RepB/Spo0J family partition protein
MHLKKIAMREIEPPKQAMRSEIEQSYLNELADSIMVLGLINPMTVAKTGPKYEIIAGNCRYLALKQLQIEFAECNVVEMDEKKLHQIKIDENFIRRGVEEFEEAIYLEALMKSHEYSQFELANAIGKSASYVNERLAILNYEPMLLKALREKQVVFSVARELNRAKDPRTIRELTRWAVTGGCTPKLARQWIKNAEYQNSVADDVDENLTPEQSAQRAAERAIHGACEVCGESVDTRLLQAVWACKKCRDELNSN